MSIAKKHGPLAANCLEIKPFRPASKHNWVCIGFGEKSFFMSKIISLSNVAL